MKAHQLRDLMISKEFTDVKSRARAKAYPHSERSGSTFPGAEAEARRREVVTV